MVGPIRTSVPDLLAIFKRVISSVLKMHDIKGSGACGDPMPKQNQSSRKLVRPTYLMELSGMLCSAEIES